MTTTTSIASLAPASASNPCPPNPRPEARSAERRPTLERWTRAGLVALLALTALAYLWDFSASGYANSFYAAAVQAGTKSWKAFFFGSIDSSNFITVDKTPASLWIMELSGRLFGFNSWSMLVPQALEGVAAVALVYAAVKRWFGAAAGLLAGLVLACTPVAALMFRFNNPDALLVLLLVASAYTLTRALENAATRWMVATGALMGFAFLAKELQAFTVLPAFAGVYLLAAPVNLRRRLWQLALGGAALVASAGWWVTIVALLPASSRPYIDGSPTNSILNLIFGYNGLSRLSGGSAGGGGNNFSGSTGIFRLFNDLMGGQAAWLLPASLLALVVGVVWRGKAPRTDRTRAALALWGGWLLVTGAVFSFGEGVIHTYYTVALAPAIAGLVGIGSALVWRQRHQLVARLVGSVAIAGTAVWSEVLLDRTPAYVPWVGVLVVVTGLVGAVALGAAPATRRYGRTLTGLAVGLGLLACLAGPLAYTATTVSTAHTGSIPSAGPTTTASIAAGGPGAVAGAGAPGGAGSPGAPGGGAPSASDVGAGFAPARGSGPREGRRSGGASTSHDRGGVRPGAERQRSGAARTESAALPTFGGASSSGPAAGGSPGNGGQGTISAKLSAALRWHASSYRWVAATFGSQSAASLELASGEPVMAIGGFNGEGGNIPLATFESYVAKGDIHYLMVSGTGGGGAPGTTNSDAAITAWAESHFTAKTIGGQTIYDLTSSK